MRIRSITTDAVVTVLSRFDSATTEEVARALGDGSKAGIHRAWRHLKRALAAGRVERSGMTYRARTNVSSAQRAE